MHFNITILFVAIITTVLCLLPAPVPNLITTETNSSIMATRTYTVDKEQFISESVIPQSLRSSRSFLFPSDWKARLKDKDQTYLTSAIRSTRLSQTFFGHSNTTLYYRIKAFNLTFDLSLIEDEVFLAPSFVIQHFDHNRTWLMKDIDHCFYKGYVNQNLSSSISVNLCHGLLGTFVYNDTRYFIEPKYHQNESKWNFEHLIYTHKDSIPLSTHNPTVRRLADAEPHLGREKYYTRYRRSPKNRLTRYNSPGLSTEIVSNTIEHPFKRRAKRQLSFDPTAKHVEVLVAYDQSFKDFHSRADIKSYILTLFSYTSHLYSDASIGNNIKIWLVKLVDLGRNNTEYIQSNDDVADILQKFCLWQTNSNTYDRYDAAVLLTRIRLCDKRAKNSTDEKCDLLGSIKPGMLCNNSTKCTVVRDNGFATALTIAHQIAHLFGIPDDNQRVCFKHTREQNIMAGSLTFNHNHYKWSNCSRYYFTKYLKSNRYLCLNNIPDYQSMTFKDLNDEQKARELPGLFFGLDEQCRRAFGDSFDYCRDLSYGPKCSRLSCREINTNTTSCITNNAHWSDGTLCSDSRLDIRRCFRGQCRNTKELQPIDGNWGEWSPWSPCTRTCGSAVQKSQRLCDNPKPENGGQYCSGQSTRIQSCENNPSCNDPMDTFRQRQCSVFNNRTVDPLLPRGVSFEPKYNVLPSERCKLICKVSDDKLERSFILGDQVEDGTPCGREEETRDICISGACMPIGCDHKYGSNATEDVCGVCNGQNKTCKLVDGTKLVSEFGITNIVNIPINTTYVTVTQISSGNDRYYLAVKHINGTYVLNGMHSLQLYNVKLRIDGALLTYTGSDSGNETVTITGRLKFQLEIQVISIYQAGASATLVTWGYYSPLDEDDLARQHDNESSVFHCNRPCEGFKQVQKCIIHGREYNFINCSTYKVPFTYKEEPCNGHCVLNWTTRYQQACSTRCGDGKKRVTYECTKSNYTERTMETMNEDTCRRYVGEKPKDVVPCVGDCTGTGWVYGNWDECHYDGGCIRKRSAECRNASNLPTSSYYCVPDFIFNTERCAEASCDQSRWNFTSWSDCDCILKRRRRTVTCVRLGKPVSERDCIHKPKPDETVSCYDECNTPHWETQLWEPCTATCASHKGVRRRHVVCSHQRSIVQDDYCDRQSKPPDQEWCSINVSCSTWSTSKWSSCSVTCGTGIKRRTVQCQQDGRPMDESKCPQPVPTEQETCISTNSAQCASVRWLTGAWTDCSATCDTGIQQRSVYCDDPSRSWVRIPDSECISLLGEHTKPSRRQNCSTTECPRWHIGSWNQCLGKCGSAERHRRISCLHNGVEVGDNYCLQIKNEKPATTEICHIELYCPDWATGMWSECSGPMCSSGMQYRQVFCRQGHDTLSNIHCDELLRPLEVQSCSVWNNTLCTHVRPLSTIDSTTSYIWDVKQFGECSRTCGTGRRLRQVHCVETLTKRPHDDQYCAQLPRKPVEYETCSLDPCPAWIVEPWSPCSVTCGTGNQHRLVSCKNREEMVSPEKCNGLNRPVTTMQCHTAPCLLGSSKTNHISPLSATWIPSEWAQCDLQSCTQTRITRCIDSMTGRLLPTSECTQNQAQPSLTRICPIPACIEWRVAHWNGCSVKCGRGIEIGFGLNCFTRQAPKRKLNASECELVEPPLPTPNPRRVCHRSCVKWRTSGWSECDCVLKRRRRTVTCVRLGKPVSERDCIQKPKPDETVSCYDECNTPHWESQLWEPCTATCASQKGIRHRRVVCSQHGSIVQDDYCDQRTKPVEQEWCSTNVSCST